VNINQVYERLRAGAAECQAGAEQSEKQSFRYKGMADGFVLAMRIMEEEGIVPDSHDNNPDVIPFRPRSS
jgi:hypothetical protein